MKALVYFCRWRGAKLRLQGRSPTAVWGELVSTQNDAETVEPFTFNLQTSQISLQTAAGELNYQLDEMGVVQNPPRT